MSKKVRVVLVLTFRHFLCFYSKELLGLGSIYNIIRLQFSERRHFKSSLDPKYIEGDYIFPLNKLILLSFLNPLITIFQLAAWLSRCGTILCNTFKSYSTEDKIKNAMFLIKQQTGWSVWG